MSVNNNNVKIKGPIAWMANNSVAANLVMAIIIIGGLFGLMRSKQEVFPEFSLDTITVQVPYPGASPNDVEQGIILAVEEAVRGLDGVKRIKSTASEGMGTVTIELLQGEDPDNVLADVKNTVDRITSFPEDSEKPIVKLLAPRARVISIIIAGKRDLTELHKIAEMVRKGLLAKKDITQVEIDGIPPLEISIEISQDTLDAYNLTLNQVAMAVKTASVELPAGSVKTSAGEILVRVSDRKIRGDEFESILLRSDIHGSKIRLGDIAEIKDGFAETDQESYYNGKRAVRVTAYRVGDETPKKVSNAVKEYKKELVHQLPKDIETALWQDDSELLTGRIKLLNTNAAYGGILVVFLLAMFLRLRLALFVALGIPISFLGAFFLFPVFDISINMITLFALIVTLGMVVDDAIVIGENIYHKMQLGLPKLQAAIEGTREMSVPIVFSILTTMVAFAPMLFVPGVMGKIFYLIPLVVILVLGFSLFEAFFILPSHVANHTGGDLEKRTGPLSRFQIWVNDALDKFINGIYKNTLMRVVRFRQISFAVAITILLLSVGVIMGGFLPFKFFPNLEGDLVRVTATLPFGTPLDETRKVQRELERAAKYVIDKNGGDKILRGIYTSLGSGPSKKRGPHAGATGPGGSHILTVEINLVPSEKRTVGSEKIRDDWEKYTKPIAGIKSIVYKSSVGPNAGAAIDIQLLSDNEKMLQQASGELTQHLRGFSKLTDVENSYSEGKQQIDFQLMPKARSLGLSSFEIARQLRNSFYGAEALREQRGREELKVMVRLPKDERVSEFNIENMNIRTPVGGQVPLSYVVHKNRNISPTSIDREDGHRVVSVKGELSPSAKSATEILKTLQSDILPELIQKYPGLSWKMGGEQREQREAFQSLGMNFVIALFAMFALIAVPFKSYLQPAIIMTAIPFGIVGAVLGHLIMGFVLSFISALGIVALSGVVVNDSLVLIDAANIKRRRGMSSFDAIIYAGTRRFRPIMLTSLTTFFGLMPMITETSLQARFLIPMAISLGFGVMFATFVTLLLIPALYMLIDDIQKTAVRFKNWVDDIETNESSEESVN